MNGQSTLSENIADVVGLRVALDAFKKTKQDTQNQKIGGFTPLQRFFLGYAYSHMGHEKRAIVRLQGERKLLTRPRASSRRRDERGGIL